MSITEIVCVLKSGGDYSKEYVDNIYEAVKRDTTKPFNFACLTDLHFTDSRYRIRKLIKDCPGWWAKIELFREPSMSSIYFDLDTIITGNIDRLLEIPNHLKPNELAMLKSFNPNRDFASGIMAWNGDFRFIFDEFDYEKDQLLKWDQFYIINKLKEYDICIKPITGVHSYKWHCRESLPKDASIVAFHGKPRPHEVKDSWVKENWG